MPALDGLRAVAVAMVFAIHAFPQSGFPGGLGVDIFFVISGFLITLILLKELRATGTISLKTFYLKRLLRLYPAFVAMVVAFVVLFPFAAASLKDDVFKSGIALTYLSNIYMTVSGDSLGHLRHTWSLAMEEQFYLLWPLLLLAIVKLRLPTKPTMICMALLIVASLAGWFFTADSLPFNPLTKAGGLLLGCVTAMLVTHKPWHSVPLAWLSAFAFLFAIVGEFLGWIGRDISMPIATLAMPGILLYLAFGSGPAVRVLAWKPLAYLGVISYALYLWHYPILYALRSANVPELTTVSITLVATLGLAILSQKYIEKPAMVLKNRIGQRSIA
jgi:peptidoglycan/LPS O-acetylase OafA/YrhL